MNLSELIKKNATVQHHKDKVIYKGESIDFYTRPLLASDQEKLLLQLGDALPTIKKLESIAKDGGGDLEGMSGKDFVLLQTAKRHYAACVLCDQNGKKLFNSYNAMINSLDNKAVDLIANYIDENVKDEDESAEEIEKN
jgi:hypothetical protein